MDIKDIMKGRKKEDLAEEILRLQTELQLMKDKDKIISELQLKIKSRDDEFQRWKEYHGEFVRRIIGEYMNDFKKLIATEIGQNIVEDLSLNDKSECDYYSRGTTIQLKYKNEVISSAYVSQR